MAGTKSNHGELARTVRWAALVVALLAAMSCADTEEVEQHLAGSTALLPSRDVDIGNVAVDGSSSVLYSNIDDGASFSSADDGLTDLRNHWGTTTSSYTAGFSGGPAGTVTQAAVNLRGRADYGVSGTIRISLLDGSTVVAQGPVRTLPSSWTNLTESFSGLSASAASNLAVRVTITAPTTGYVRLTQLWLEVVTNSTGTAATKHFAANMATYFADVQSGVSLDLKLNIVDISGSTSNPAGVKTKVDALPAGVQGLVWVGNLDNTNCATPGFTDAQFRAQVDALAHDPKVLGYYISDEPHPKTCTTAAADIRARADYIHARAPGQIAFIVVLDGSNACGSNLGCEYNALQPSYTHVDLFGLDPYPCHYNSSGTKVCETNKISERFSSAVANGIPASRVVPTFQTVGQEGRLDGKPAYYATPSPTDLKTMLDIWKSLTPAPVFDYAYTYGIQCTTTSCPASQALKNHPELQSVLQTHNL